MMSLQEMPAGFLLDHHTCTTAPLLTALTTGLAKDLVTDDTVTHVAVSQLRGLLLVTDGMVVLLVGSQHGRGSVEHDEAPAVTVNRYARAALPVTGPGYLSVRVPHPDAAAAVEAEAGAAVEAEAAAAGLATCPSAGRPKSPSCLRGWGSHSSPHWGQRFQAAVPWLW